MLSMFAMYLLVKCTAIQLLFQILCSIAFGIFACSIVISFLRADDVSDIKAKEIYKEHRIFTWPSFVLGIVFLLLYFAMPNTKEMAVIYVTPKVVNSVMANEQIQKLPDNLLSLANAWIEEFKPDTNAVKVDGTKTAKKSEGKSIPDSTKQKIADRVIDRVVEEVTK